MPFVPKKQAFNAHINEVVLGVGDKATAIGGQNVLPFHTFDAEIKNAPKIGVELTDLGMAEYTMPAVCMYSSKRAFTFLMLIQTWSETKPFSCSARKRSTTSLVKGIL